MNKYLRRLLLGRRLSGPQGEGGEGGGGGTGGTEGGTVDPVVLAAQLEEVKGQLTIITKDRDELKKNQDRLMDDAKKARAKSTEEEIKARKAEEAKAREEGNYQQLLKGAEEKNKELEQSYTSLQSTYAKEKAAEHALKIARELTNPARPHDASLLADLLAPRLQYDFAENEIKVLDPKGERTFLTLADLQKEVDNDERYSSLLKSSQRSGGGAAGSRGGASQNKQMTRKEFDALPALTRDERVKTGWKIVD